LTACDAVLEAAAYARHGDVPAQLRSLYVAGLPCTRTVKAKFHYAILVAEGPEQVRSWSQTYSELKFGLYHLARQQRTSTR